MESSRDSSIWRNLAVAFGDGVAFGVGIKLAQGPNRPPAGAPPAAVSPTSPDPARLDQLNQIEQRLAALERAPAVSLPPSAPAPFDQKVLEAVVNALDARLHEQAGQVERRLTELEAKLAIDLKSLHQQDHSIVTGLQGRIEEVHGQYNEHVTAIRDAVAEDMDILYGQIAQLRQAYDNTTGAVLDQRIAAAITSQLESRMASLDARLRDDVARTVDRVSSEAASAASARLDQQLVPVHAALAEKDREIADLRQRLADNDQTVLDLILAIGEMCRQVAERISGPAPVAASAREGDSSGDSGPSTGPSPDPPAAPGPEEAPPSAEPPASPVARPPAAAADADRNGHGPIGPMPIESERRPSRLWRIPLVSSFLILAAGSLWLLK